MNWHVQYSEKGETRVAWRTRPEAVIDLACYLLDRGVDVFGIGAEDLTESLDRTEIARIHANWVRAQRPFGSNH